MAATDKESVLPQLQAEKDNLDPSFVHASKLISEELERVKSGKPKNQVEEKPVTMLDVHIDKPVKVSCKLRIPNREFPKLNFVGKLLGPKGQTMKDMQTNTGTKMYIYGKGSMRDKAREEELRKEGGKHAHLSGDLHLHIEAFYPAEEAYKRIASGIEEAKKYLDPASFEQMQPDIPSLGGMDSGYGGGGYQNGDGAGRGRGMGRGGPPGGAPRGGRGGSMLSPSRGGMSSRGAPAPRGGLGGAPRGGPGMRGAPARGAPSGRGRGGPVGRGRPEPLLDDGYGNSMGGGGGYEEPYQESYGADTSYGGDAGYGGQEQAGYGRESASTETYDYGHGSGGGGGRDQYYEEPAYGGAPSGGRGGYSGGQSGGARGGGYAGQSSGPRGGGAGGYAGGQSGGRGGSSYGGGRGGGAGGDQWGSGAGRGMKAPNSRGGGSMGGEYRPKPYARPQY